MDYKVNKIDYEKFSFYFDVFNKAAAMQIPCKNPETVSFGIEDDGEIKQYSFSDIPVNRGMMAIMDEMRNVETEDDIFSIGMRVMAFGEFVNDRKFSKFFKTEDGDMYISESLLKAISEAKYKKSGGINKKDVMKIANREEQLNA